jgi:hypothetical protein
MTKEMIYAAIGRWEAERLRIKDLRAALQITAIILGLKKLAQ